MKQLIVFSILFSLISCNSKPTVIQPVQHSESSSTSNAGSPEKSHEGVVLEVLHTSKYTYLLLEVLENKHWIAISKADIKTGEKIKYTEGVRMFQFKSSELDRTFDEINLVSKISRADGSTADLFQQLKEGPEPAVKEKIIMAKGSVPLSDLFGSPEKYAGKKIQVTGRCTKINYQIMGRNWIHLEDESKNGKNLTITSNSVLEPGKVGTFEGIIALNKDFGSGYQYNIIMEDAVLK